MTNKNKKITRLVNAADTDPTDQFEIIPTLTEPVNGPSDLLESNEKTYDIEHDGDNLRDKSKADLLAILRSRSRNIEELKFQLEQALGRRRGLEKELEVREEITSTINSDIDDARKQLRDAAVELETLNTDYQLLRQAYTNADVLAKELGEEMRQTRATAELKDQRIDELERSLASSKSELADLRLYIDGRKRRWDEHELRLAEIQEQLLVSRRDCATLETDAAGREQVLAGLRQELQETGESLQASATDLERLKEENRELKSALHTDAEREIRRCRDRIAMQSGELAARAQELQGLRKDNERFEAYANILRQQLQDQAGTARQSTSECQKLEAGLEAASKLIDDLSQRLEDANGETQALARAKQELQDHFDNEIRQIRFELSDAQRTIADQDTVNEQLASDLIDNQGFRLALETHLGDLEKRKDRQIEKLSRRLGKAEDLLADNERKLRIKDGAIADLMKELGNRSGTVEFGIELESALKKIDGHRREEQRVRRRGERDHRVARLLIGNADGKELRFPLFRNRLTIGRTPHNDIQLDMRFISRRHAVIATDNNKTRIIDWGSRNGVFVNKQRVTEKILDSGDVITIGLTNLRYEERPKR
jgi:chromosome segregation ATPase